MIKKFWPVCPRCLFVTPYAGEVPGTHNLICRGCRQRFFACVRDSKGGNRMVGDVVGTFGDEIDQLLKSSNSLLHQTFQAMMPQWPPPEKPRKKEPPKPAVAKPPETYFPPPGTLQPLPMPEHTQGAPFRPVPVDTSAAPVTPKQLTTLKQLALATTVSGVSVTVTYLLSQLLS